jgi:hypothetical protein
VTRESTALFDDEGFERQVVLADDQPGELSDLRAVARIDGSPEVKIPVVSTWLCAGHGFKATQCVDWMRLELWMLQLKISRG